VPPEALNQGAGAIYCGSWIPMHELDMNDPEDRRRAKDIEEYFRIIDWGVSKGKIAKSQQQAYYVNAYSTSSYIAIKMFLTGLERLRAAGKPYTPENYLEVMENGRCPVALSGSVDFTNGLRIGLDTLALVKYELPKTGKDPATGFFIEVEPMASIDELAEKLQ
jgi:hypothetical protein